MDATFDCFLCKTPGTSGVCTPCYATLPSQSELKIEPCTCEYLIEDCVCFSEDVEDLTNLILDPSDALNISTQAAELDAHGPEIGEQHPGMTQEQFENLIEDEPMEGISTANNDITIQMTTSSTFTISVSQDIAALLFQQLESSGIDISNL